MLDSDFERARPRLKPERRLHPPALSVRTHSPRDTMPNGAFFILPLLYMAGVLAIVVFALIALWRMVKAQEAAADSLRQIAHTVSRFGPPA